MNSYIESLYRKPVEWHERRRKAIGGSDANIIMGGNSEDIYRLWQEKRGEAESEDLSDVLPVLMGTLTEPLNVAWFEKKTGLEVTRAGASATKDIMSVTLDGFIESENAILECKHVGGFQPWEEIVEKYYPQLTHNMYVYGCEAAYLSAFIGSAQWRSEKVTLDPFYLEQLLEAEKGFWESVKSGVSPVTPPKAEVNIGDATRIVDMSKSNSFMAAASDYIANKAGADLFSSAKDALKSLVESDVKVAHGGGIIITRDRKGSLRFKEGNYDAK